MPCPWTDTDIEVAALDETGVEDALVQLRACRSALEWHETRLVRRLSEVRADAHVAVRQALGLSSRTALSRTKTAAALAGLPATDAALRAGRLTLDHASVIARTVAESDGRLIEADLLDDAGSVPADTFARRARAALYASDPDGGDARRDTRRRKRTAGSSERPEDGMGQFFALLDPVDLDELDGILAGFTDDLWRHETPGRRLQPGQRRADALMAMARSARDGTTTPPGVAKATVFVIAHYDALTQKLTDIGLLDGTPVTIDELHRLACNARVLPAIFDTGGQPLWLGRSSRLPTPGLRAAVTARDRHCTIDGCDVPAKWCQVHHITHWLHGGPTDIDNLTLLCSVHHHMVHDDGFDLIPDTDGFSLAKTARHASAA